MSRQADRIGSSDSERGNHGRYGITHVKKDDDNNSGSRNSESRLQRIISHREHAFNLRWLWKNPPCIAASHNPSLSVASPLSSATTVNQSYSGNCSLDGLAKERNFNDRSCSLTVSSDSSFTTKANRRERSKLTSRSLPVTSASASSSSSSRNGSNRHNFVNYWHVMKRFFRGSKSEPCRSIEAFCDQNLIFYPLSELLTILYEKGPRAPGIFRRSPNHHTCSQMMSRMNIPDTNSPFSITHHYYSGSRRLLHSNPHSSSASSVDDKLYEENDLALKERHNTDVLSRKPEVKYDDNGISECYVAATTLKKLLCSLEDSFFSFDDCELWDKLISLELGFDYKPELKEIMPTSFQNKIKTLIPSDKANTLARKIVNGLSQAKQLFLVYFTCILFKIHVKSEVTKMDAENLAICTSSTLFRLDNITDLVKARDYAYASSSFISYLIRNCHSIFGINVTDLFDNPADRAKLTPISATAFNQARCQQKEREVSSLIPCEQPAIHVSCQDTVCSARTNVVMRSGNDTRHQRPVSMSPVSSHRDANQREDSPFIGHNASHRVTLTSTIPETDEEARPNVPTSSRSNPINILRWIKHACVMPESHLRQVAVTNMSASTVHTQNTSALENDAGSRAYHTLSTNYQRALDVSCPEQTVTGRSRTWKEKDCHPGKLSHFRKLRGHLVKASPSRKTDSSKLVIESLGDEDLEYSGTDSVAADARERKERAEEVSHAGDDTQACKKPARGMVDYRGVAEEHVFKTKPRSPLTSPSVNIKAEVGSSSHYVRISKRKMKLHRVRSSSADHDTSSSEGHITTSDKKARRYTSKCKPINSHMTCDSSSVKLEAILPINSESSYETLDPLDKANIHLPRRRPSTSASTMQPKLRSSLTSMPVSCSFGVNAPTTCKSCATSVHRKPSVIQANTQSGVHHQRSSNFVSPFSKRHIKKQTPDNSHNNGSHSMLDKIGFKGNKKISTKTSDTSRAYRSKSIYKENSRKWVASVNRFQSITRSATSPPYSWNSKVQIGDVIDSLASLQEIIKDCTWHKLPTASRRNPNATQAISIHNISSNNIIKRYVQSSRLDMPSTLIADEQAGMMLMSHSEIVSYAVDPYQIRVLQENEITQPIDSCDQTSSGTCPSDIITPETFF